jgi:hypothetical protein
MDKLKQEIIRIEPRIDLLHDILGFGRFAEVTLTSDGFFLGRRHGDIGFNNFLGLPSQAAVNRTKALYKQLSDESQKKIILVFLKKGYPLNLIQETTSIAVNRKILKMS